MMNGQFFGVSGNQNALPLGMFCRTGVLLVVFLMAEGVAVLLALAPGVEGERWVRLGLMSLLVLWVALMWVAGLCLARRALGRYSALRVAWVAVLWLVVVSVSVGSLAFGFLAEAGVRLGEVAWFVGHVAVISAVVGLLGLMGFYAFWQAQGWAVRAREAELAALHARIRPHFLFNTLNSIASLIPTRPAEAETMVVDFAQLLRAALAEAGLVRLTDELAVVRGYLAIEAVRLEGRLRVVWSGDVLADESALRGIRVPSLSIQPLVENAVRYGVEPLREGGEVAVDISRTGDEVVVTVRNALVDLGERCEGAGMALANVRARVLALGGRLEVMRGDGVFVVRLAVLRTDV